MGKTVKGPEDERIQDGHPKPTERRTALYDAQLQAEAIREAAALETPAPKEGAGGSWSSKRHSADTATGRLADGRAPEGNDNSRAS